MPAVASVLMEQLAIWEGIMKPRELLSMLDICQIRAPMASAMVMASPVLLGVPQGKKRTPG